MRLENEFCTPANQRRVLQIIHGMPESHAERQELFEALLSGLGGIITNVSFKDYLRNESIGPISSTACRRVRLAWCCGSRRRGLPSGLAGGLTQAGNLNSSLRESLTIIPVARASGHWTCQQENWWRLLGAAGWRRGALAAQVAASSKTDACAGKLAMSPVC